MFSKIFTAAACAAAAVNGQQTGNLDFVLAFRRQRADQTHTINNLTSVVDVLYSKGLGSPCTYTADCAGAAKTTPYDATVTTTCDKTRGLCLGVTGYTTSTGTDC